MPLERGLARSEDRSVSEGAGPAWSAGLERDAGPARFTKATPAMSLRDHGNSVPRSSRMFCIGLDHRSVGGLAQDIRQRHLVE